MNKLELVKAIAKSADLSQAAAEKTVNAFIATVTKALNKGDRVTIVGFGSFEVASKKASAGRKPQTGKQIRVAASRIPMFRPGKALIQATGRKTNESIRGQKATLVEAKTVNKLLTKRVAKITTSNQHFPKSQSGISQKIS